MRCSTQLAGKAHDEKNKMRLPWGVPNHRLIQGFADGFTDNCGVTFTKSMLDVGAALASARFGLLPCTCTRLIPLGPRTRGTFGDLAGLLSTSRRLVATEILCLSAGESRGVVAKVRSHKGFTGSDASEGPGPPADGPRGRPGIRRVVG